MNRHSVPSFVSMAAYSMVARQQIFPLFEETTRGTDNHARCEIPLRLDIYGELFFIFNDVLDPISPHCSHSQ